MLISFYFIYFILVCGVQKLTSENIKEPLVSQVIPVAGDLNNKQSGVNFDRYHEGDQNGVRVHFKGGSWGDYGAIDAYVDFVCDKELDTEEKSVLTFDDWDLHTLRLIWRSAFACPLGSNGDDKPPNNSPPSDKNPENPPQSGSGWGFFSWVFFLLFFGGIAYVLLMIWMEYSRYGQVDFSSLPFGEYLRDIPLIVKELFAKITSLSSNSSSERSGYSAV